MIIDVTKERVAITQCHVVTEGEYCVNECEFQLPECFDGLTVTAVFNDIPVPLLNNKCFIPSLKKGGAVLGVYAYRKNGDALELVYSPKPTAFYVDEGSYTGANGIEETPDISKYEEYCTMLSQLCENLISQIDYIEKASLTQSISTESTHSQVPTAGAVYEYGRKITEEINKDITELSEKQTEIMSLTSNTLKGKSSGNPVVIEDASPIAHKLDCCLKSLNLSSVSTTGAFKQRKQITFDKTFPAGVYSFSAIVETDDIDSSVCLFSFTLNNTSKKASSISRSVDGQRVSVQNILIPTEFNGICFYASVSNAAAIDDTAEFSDIQLEAGEAATDYKPYFNCDNQAVISSGKNLCSLTDIECTPDTENGGASEKSIALAYTLPATNYSLSAVVGSNDIDSDRCLISFKYDEGITQPRTVGSCLLERSVNGNRVKAENVYVNEAFNVITFLPASTTDFSVDDIATFNNFQLEFGASASEYQEPSSFESAISDENGCVDALHSSSPITNVFTSGKGALINVSYNRDINKAIATIENALSS